MMPELSSPSWGLRTSRALLAMKNISNHGFVLLESLTADSPGPHYWRALAELRGSGAALDPEEFSEAGIELSEAKPPAISLADGRIAWRWLVAPGVPAVGNCFSHLSCCGPTLLSRNSSLSGRET